MKERNRFATWRAAALLLVAAATVAAVGPTPPDKDRSATTTGYDVTTWIDANRLLMFVTNTGGFGSDQENLFGYSGLYFPYLTVDDIISGYLDRTVMFAAGPWMGAIDHETGETLTVICEFSDEFWPGPMIDGTFDPNGEANPNYRVFKLYADSLAENPGGDYDDYLTYAVAQGAPVDEFGEPVVHGDQTLWTVYNDANPEAKTNYASATAPLGIEIQQTVWASFEGENMTSCCGEEAEAGKSTATMIDQSALIIYMKYLIFNRGDRTLDSCYFSIWSDPDLGSASDDLVGCDTLADLFFCYNGTDEDYQYGDQPPAVGFKFLHGPLVASPGDSACFDGTWVPDHRNLNMTAVSKYVGGDDPDNYTQVYNYMNGLEKLGTPLPNGTKYICPGDPVTNSGDLDFAPDDRRMMGTCGPFNMNPGDSQYVMVKLAVAQSENHMLSISRMREVLNDLYSWDTTDYIPEPELPESFWLSQNYPNPFNPTTTIDFDLPVDCRARIDIYNSLGQKVKTLINGVFPAGFHSVVWNGTDNAGRVVASGVYFYELDVSFRVETRKMMLAR